MPMDFPDMQSLESAAKVHKFREIQDDELLSDYRKELAKHVLTIDRIEAFEILFDHGWDSWTDEEKMTALRGRIS